MSYQYNIIYTAGGKVHKTHHSETVDFEIREEINGDILTLTLLPKTDITFQKFEIKDNISFSKESKFFVNGYQSWTVSKEYAPNDDMRDDFDPKLLSVLDKKSFNIRGIWGAGDLTFHEYPEQSGIFYGYSYAYIRNAKEQDTQSLRLMPTLQPFLLKKTLRALHTKKVRKLHFLNFAILLIILTMHLIHILKRQKSISREQKECAATPHGTTITQA